MRKCYVLLTAGSLLAVLAHGQTISTYAGKGSAGYSGDGGQATAAQLNAPAGVTVDASGNVYIADLNNNVIRKVTAATGIITTVAGTGTAGYSGDGGQATAATLDGPEVIALDASGNIYEVEQTNAVVREINVSTGIIKTVAGNGTNGFSGDGGQATAAKLNNPQGLTVDASGNIYIADQSNNRIRKVTSAGVISTVAGTGTAGFSGDGGQATAAKLDQPAAVDVDNQGNVYIADYLNNRIRKITVSTGIITTVVGTGTAGFSGDGAAATAAKINQPYGINVYGSGDMLISDYANNRVRLVLASSGKISTAVGNGTAGFSGDGGSPTAAKVNGPLQSANYNTYYYVADWKNNRIRQISGVTPLPIALLTFSGEYDAERGITTLSWSTSSEVNNRAFFIERSSDGTNWTNIDTVAGSGNSDVVKNYSALDLDPPQGVIYYRLSQEDYDGHINTYKVIEVTVTVGTAIKLFPNPASSIIVLQGEFYNIRVFDTEGKELMQSEESGQAFTTLNISTLPIGVYVIQASDKVGNLHAMRFIKN